MTQIQGNQLNKNVNKSKCGISSGIKPFNKEKCQISKET